MNNNNNENNATKKINENKKPEKQQQIPDNNKKEEQKPTKQNDKNSPINQKQHQQHSVAVQKSNNQIAGPLKTNENIATNSPAAECKDVSDSLDNSTIPRRSDEKDTDGKKTSLFKRHSCLYKSSVDNEVYGPTTSHPQDNKQPRHNKGILKHKNKTRNNENEDVNVVATSGFVGNTRNLVQVPEPYDKAEKLLQINEALMAEKDNEIEPKPTKVKFSDEPTVHQYDQVDDASSESDDELQQRP